MTTVLTLLAGEVLFLPLLRQDLSTSSLVTARIEKNNFFFFLVERKKKNFVVNLVLFGFCFHIHSCFLLQKFRLLSIIVDLQENCIYISGVVLLYDD